MSKVYEIVEVHKHGVSEEANSSLIGRRYILSVLEEGYRGMLVHAENQEKMMLTSVVKHVTKMFGDFEIVFTTANTTYSLRYVCETEEENECQS